MGIDDIKAEYPNPIKYKERTYDYFHPPVDGEYREEYSVSGAFCKYIEQYTTIAQWSKYSIAEEFAEPGCLARYLEFVVESLTWEALIEYAEAIIGAEDKGAFEIAWEILETVLTYKGKRL